MVCRENVVGARPNQAEAVHNVLFPYTLAQTHSLPLEAGIHAKRDGATHNAPHIIIYTPLLAYSLTRLVRRANTTSPSPASRFRRQSGGMRGAAPSIRNCSLETYNVLFACTHKNNHPYRHRCMRTHRAGASIQGFARASGRKVDGWLENGISCARFYWVVLTIEHDKRVYIIHGLFPSQTSSPTHNYNAHTHTHTLVR